MKNRILYLIMALAAGTMLSCQEDIPYSGTAAQGFNSVSAMFANGDFKSEADAVFTTYVDPAQEEIFVKIPWFYPVDTDNAVTDITEMRLIANIDANCTIDPHIGGIRDLNDKLYVTFTNKNGVRTRHYITGAITKLPLKSIVNFKLADGTDGVVNEAARSIMLVTSESVPSATAIVEISPHSAISPDPTVPRSYDAPVEFTVTAHDGSTAVWTVAKGIPGTIESGYRPGSEKLMWAKKLKDDLGITTLNMTGGMAVTDDCVVLNTRNEASIYLDRKTGEKVGEINLGSVQGGTTNFYNTADDDGNILINNLTPNNGNVFKVWKLSSVTGTPTAFIEYDGGGLALGRKLSVQGSVDNNAIITVGVNTMGSTFARWQVVGGALVSSTPEMVTISGDGYVWSNNNVDIVSSSATNAKADYFTASYNGSYITSAWVNGANNAVRALMPNMNVNYIPNAIDYKVFNGVPYVAYNYVNGQNFGVADMICLAQANNAQGYTGAYTPYSPSNIAAGTPVVGEAIKWIQPGGVYGSRTLGIDNGNGTGDVAFKISPDGYYLYLYFMFTNGYVVCYRFDCIDI